MSVVNAPVDAVNMAIGKATNAISKALPSFPAATMGMPVLGYPHAHAHPPSLIPPAPPIPLLPIGTILFGCSVTVLINGVPAARVGDLGLSPTCGGIFPQFEIFTGSSKVFIGGMRAARMLDFTMHCWPAKDFAVRGAIAGLVAAANAANVAMMAAGITAQVAGIAADAADASASSGEVASASALSAAMGAAQLAADAVAMAFGMLMGKDPGIGPPIGTILVGHPNVLIGGFPMPSGMNIANRLLDGAKRMKRKKGRNDEGDAGCGSCGGR